jgi:amino acid adenylation domain-containing protein
MMTESTTLSHGSSIVDIVETVPQNPSRIREITEDELEKLWGWNSIVPPTINQCIHEIILSSCQSNPNSLAVQSWDGNLTYAQLDRFSTQVAGSILATNVDLDIIPVCFEKSRWTAVAVLGVMKAGACFALLDPVQPEGRLVSIVEQVNAKIILTSEKQRESCSILTENAQVIIVDGAMGGREVDLPSVPSDSKMYVQFTSGSTGKPKGIVISHKSYTSGALPRSEIVGYGSDSRVLDFASYAFDVSIDCMLCTFSQGGCLCVPSDEARINDLAGTIKALKVNMVHMTPSIARILDSDTLSSLKILGLGGELVTAGDAAIWSRYTTIRIFYGPSECTVGCTANGNVVPRDTNPTIGKGVGRLTWIVDPEDHDRLMPVGAIGELLIEGPIVGQGYLNRNEKASTNFISDPKWLVAGFRSIAGRHGRLYKTGDLVKYDNDGSIIFIGRKDSQVKLRGQRVELTEVEHHLRLYLASHLTVAAEVITPNSSGAKPTLVAFVAAQYSGNAECKDGEIKNPETPLDLKHWLGGIDEKLVGSVPAYMAPSTYIPLESLPMMVSGKLDRKRLQEIGSMLSLRQLSELRSGNVKPRVPESSMEYRLQQIWSALFGVGSNEILASDNFFSLGGDSITVMRLVGTVRSEGFFLRAQDVFLNPILYDLASIITISDIHSETEVIPFSMLEPDLVESVTILASKFCAVTLSSI